MFRALQRAGSGAEPLQAGGTDPSSLPALCSECKRRAGLNADVLLYSAASECCERPAQGMQCPLVQSSCSY